MNLLVVDDHLTNLKLLRAQLEAEGHAVFEAHDGVDALAVLERQRVDAVISDILMPRMDGYRLCHEIRKHARLRDQPILIYSATYTSLGDEKLALGMGADKYLKKPASVETIIAALHEVIAMPHAAPRPDARREVEVLKEYNERLVSKLKEKNTELQAAEVKFRALVEQSIVGIYIVQDDQFVYVNPGMAGIFGWSQEEMTSRTLSDFIAPEDQALARDNIRKRIFGEVPSALYSLRVLHQSGAVLQVEVHSCRTEYNGRPAVMGMLLDITERKRAEEQLIISDRMVSMGTLAAGVAHEINNPLAALIANLDMIAEEISLPADSDSGPGVSRDAGVDAGRLAGVLAVPVEDAREAAQRIRNIAGDLKVFSRASDERSDAVDLRHVIESSLRMAMNEIRHRARVTQQHDDLPDVAGNESRLGQVFLNLLINAAQAIPEGAADRNEIRITTSCDGNGRVVAEVSDTGSGIPESIANRIFDPFFTTKPVGVGTGLGLAICHRIVTAMGGEITVQSKVGEGTVFRVYLPQVAGQKRRVTPRNSPVIASRKGRVLVIDDEPMLRGVIRRMLASEHMVEELSDAGEALRRMSAGERFDVILSDLMMPGMTGMELHAEVAKLDPDQAGKIIFMTGGAFTDRAREFLDAVPNPRLDKPFTVQELRLAVNGMVD